MKVEQVWRTFDEGAALFWLNGYDVEGYQRPGRAACLVEIDGKRLLLRNGSSLLWFRYEDSNHTEWTYFFYDSADQSAYKLDEAWLERQFLSKQFGRVVPVPMTPDPAPIDYKLIYFRTDGTGCINPGPYQDDFSWEELSEKSIDPLHEPFEAMSHLGRLVYDAWELKRATTEASPTSLKGQPVEFINGSQEELERVTRWICHSGIGEPNYPRDSWAVEYFAPDIEFNQAGGISEGDFHASPKLRDLFNLAYEYNSFTGYYWEYNDGDPSHVSGYDAWPAEVRFSFPIATQAEKDESKLKLIGWLAGKVTAEEQQHLLGAPEILQNGYNDDSGN